ncbi:hypothetical protein [Pleomorphovibrio marinus]|uniref:hypothetical protein n=1 Tax=Pleomorphovibrio marinus TaxID=2164132 RepID=UPI000E0C46FB|nr:hypothetical protein [Pleomorphovibrio marinus]
MKNRLCISIGTFIVAYWILPQLICMAQQAQIRNERVQVFVSDRHLVTGEDLWLDINVFLNEAPSPVKVVYAEILDREGTSVSQQLIGVSKGHARGFLPVPENLDTDNYLLRVYTRSSPYTSGETGVYHDIIAVINPESAPNPNAPLPDKQLIPKPSSLLSVDKKQYSTQEKVALKIENIPVRENVRLAVRHTIPIQGEKMDIDWADVYTEKDWEAKQAIPEIYGHVIKGRTVSTPIDTAEVFYLTAHGASSHLFITKPNEQGQLLFETGAFRHYDYVVVQSGKSQDQVNFVLDSPFWPAVPRESFRLPRLVVDPAHKERIKERILAKSVNQYFIPKSYNPPQDFASVINPDRSYLLDDYNRFDDIATVIREYVPHVLIRKQNRKTLFRTYNKPHENMFKNNPLLLIDAMPVFDADAFAELNPKNIKRLDLLTRYFFYEKETFEGVISLTSFENDFGKFDLPKSALFIEYKGIQVPVENDFTRPPSTARKPDFRNILIWEPSLSPKNDSISFTTSQLSGEYQINLSFLHPDTQVWENHILNFSVK